MDFAQRSELHFKLSTLHNIEGMWRCKIDSPADWLRCGLYHSVTGSMWGLVWIMTSLWKVMCNRVWQGRTGYWKYRLTGRTGLKPYLTTLTEGKANLTTALIHILSWCSGQNLVVVFFSFKGQNRTINNLIWIKMIKQHIYIYILFNIEWALNIHYISNNL